MSPTRPLRPCTVPGCPRLGSGGRCDEHRRDRYRRIDDHRESAAKRGYGVRWRRLRRMHLACEPLCRACKAQGRTREATEVDHIRPHRGDPGLMWDALNLQSLCKPCHSAKTMGGT